MHRNTVEPGDHADNVVGRDRATAAGDLREHTLSPRHQHTVVAHRAAGLLQQGFVKVAHLNSRLVLLLPVIQVNEGVNNLLCGQLVLADSPVHGCHVVLMQSLRHLGHQLGAHHLLQRQLIIAHALRQRLTPTVQRLKTTFFRKVLADLCAGP